MKRLLSKCKASSDPEVRATMAAYDKLAEIVTYVSQPVEASDGGK